MKVLSGLLPACLTVCPGSACCLCCPLILGRLFFEPQKPRDNRNHDNTTLRQVCKTLLQKSEYEYGLDHVRGIRCCESNESRLQMISDDGRHDSARTVCVVRVVPTVDNRSVRLCALLTTSSNRHHLTCSYPAHITVCECTPIM